MVEFDDEEVDDKKGRTQFFLGQHVCTSMKVTRTKSHQFECDETVFVHLIPDEDGTEFEKDLTSAVDGLSVSATAEKLIKV